jgi:carbon-monoxide dehydrogenase small subunit
VLLEGKPIYACQILAVQVGERPVVTVEGLGEDDKLDRIQQAFLDNDGAQCGYCTPGFLLSAKALLEANPRPTELEIREALSGNLCRCNAYGRILQSVRDSAGPAPRSGPVARTGK